MVILYNYYNIKQYDIKIFLIPERQTILNFIYKNISILTKL
jgi:hypothetical protein